MTFVGCFCQKISRKWDVLSGVAEMAWDVLSVAANMAWDVMSRVTKTVWDVLSRVANLCGVFCLGCQKKAWMFCPRMFCPASFGFNGLFLHVDTSQ